MNAPAWHRVVFLVLQLAHLAWFGSILDAGFDAAALTASGAACGVLYAGLLAAEYRWNGFRVTPILFYLAAGVFRLGAGTMFVVAAADAGEWHVLRVGAYDVSAMLAHGHWLALLGDWCFIAGYAAMASLRGRGFPTPARVSPAVRRRAWRAGVGTAAAAFLLRFAERYVSFGGLDSLLGYIQTYGVAAGAYVMLLAARRGGDGWLFTPAARAALVLLALDLVAGVFSYSKSPLLIGVLPLVLIGFDHAGAGSWPWLRRQLLRPAAGACLVIYFFLFVVSVYSPSRRTVFREYGSSVAETNPYEVPVVPHLADALAGAVPGTAEFREAHRFPNGAWHLIGRMSMTPFPAWAYQRVASAGFRQAVFLDELLVSVTPRILWPGKPELAHGREFAVAIGHSSSMESASTSIALTMQGAWYWWGGYFWLVLGCGLSGAGFAGAWLLFRDECGVNPVSAVVMLLLCHEGFRWFESAFLGGFPMFLYLLLVFLPLQLVMRRVVGYRTVTLGRAAWGPA